MAERSAWEWRRCPTRGETLTQRWGTSTRAPWFPEGRRIVVVPRHFRTVGRATYSERSALPVRGGWYAREVRRAAIDHARRVGGSVRKTAEWLRRPGGGAAGPARAPSRWLDQAGRKAEESGPDRLAGGPGSGQPATDGRWARLRGKTKKVVAPLAESASGLIRPPVVAGARRAGRGGGPGSERSARGDRRRGERLGVLPGPLARPQQRQVDLQQILHVALGDPFVRH